MNTIDTVHLKTPYSFVQTEVIVFFLTLAESFNKVQDVECKYVKILMRRF